MLKGKIPDRNAADNLTMKAKDSLLKGTQNNRKKGNMIKIKRSSTTFSNTMIAVRTEGSKNTQ